MTSKQSDPNEFAPNAAQQPNSVFKRVMQPMVDEEQHLMGIQEEDEALPLRPIAQINIHTLPGGAITLFDSSEGCHSEVR